MNASRLRVLVVVNDPSSLKSSSTTMDILRGGDARGWDMLVAGVRGFALDENGQPWVKAVNFQTGEFKSQALTGVDGVLVRTNPARDSLSNIRAHGFALRTLQRACDHGVTVINHPAGLKRSESKEFLLELSESDRPRMVVTHEAEVALAFAQDLPVDAVVKPAHGTHGRGVTRLRRDAAGHRDVITCLLEDGPVVVQPFLPAARDGDTRVLLVDGDFLTSQGLACAVCRIPPPGDFRSNVAAGGVPAPGTITPAIQRVVGRVGPMLRDAGLWFVGLDFIGGLVIEVNAFSPGGLADASRFAGVDFGTALMERLESRFRTGATAPSGARLW